VLQLEFDKPPCTGDWIKFNKKYARRVRVLRFKDRVPLSTTLFDDIGRTRTSLNILPNLRTLEWASPTEQPVTFMAAVVFMHKDVQRLSLTCTVDDNVSDYFYEIVSRTPLLAVLDLRLQMPMHEVEDEVLGLLRGLPRLRKVILPNYHLTSRIMEELSRHVELGVVQFEYGKPQGIGSSTDVQEFFPEIEEGAFPALWDLSLSVRLPDMCHFLRSPYFPRNLTILYIDSPSPVPESPAAVHEILTTIAENCQKLESLYLALLNNTTSVTAPGPEDQITFETLRPLLACTRLKAFELTHEYPLQLTLENLEELASTWTLIEKLLLNCEPPYLAESTLTLRALVPLTRCERLRHLGLYMNATATDIPSAWEDVSELRSLNTISVGDSDISEESAVAIFLARVCPMNTIMECGITWHEDLQTAENGAWMTQEITKRCDKWKKVGELLPILTKVRVEQGEASRLLKAEVEDLRMRTSVLMDREKALPHAGCVVV
jgi:hypothetical protein